MASQHRPQLSRLNLSGPQSLNMQQPMSFNNPQGQMFSPGLPTSIQQGYHAPFSMNGPLQTPMQQMFPPQMPSAPGRPSFASHRAGQVSIAQLAAAGIHPPNAMPVTPLGQGFQMSGPMPFGPPGPAFVPRNRRTPSMSLGGPPKAVLGGPNRKVSPLPPVVVAAVEQAPTPAIKGKKMTVKLPRETMDGADRALNTRPSWARTPIPLCDVGELYVPPPPDASSGAEYPTDAERHSMPDSLDVYLPGKNTWEAIKKLDIEEKLQKLGVEPGSGSTIPFIHAPHGRSVSVSSPADSALLYYKLNKLQQSQNSSVANSLSASPQPPFGLSPSPNTQFQRLTNRHGHSMSLAQPPTQSAPFYTPSPTFNPFGPHATLGDSPGQTTKPLENIFAPQGRVPVTAASLAIPVSSSRPDSRPDFSRGFGLDVPEEEEEELEEPEAYLPAREDGNDSDKENSYDVNKGLLEHVDQDGMMTASQSRLHSRHVSDALSLGYASENENGLAADELAVDELDLITSSPVGRVEIDDMDEEAIGEWTGSEDLHHGDSDDEESIGEYSNPSDEERARQDRVHRRAIRTRREIETPRNLPNFPRPPESTQAGAFTMDEDMISNPSEEGMINEGRRSEYLGVQSGEYFVRPASAASSTRSYRPLPAIPHSRGGSGQISISGFDPALAHSRAPSQPFVFAGGASSVQTLNGPSLNPKAKPFVFGSSSGSWAPSAFGRTSAPPPTLTQPPSGHDRQASFGKALNATAQEFKPGGFTFRPPFAAPQMPASAPELDRPLPSLLAHSSPPRAVQGREKRQRRASRGSFDGDDEDGNSTMSSFKFPPGGPESPASVRRSAPNTPRLFGAERRRSSLNAAAQPFTFGGFSNVLPFVHTEPPIQLPHPLVPTIENPDGAIVDASTPKTDYEDLPSRNLPLPPSSRQKRAPIPLDFKNPTHSNTVPAGLFKAHVNGEERTRRTVRSRLGSREIFDHVHRPSMDDLAVMSISRTISRPRVTEAMHSRQRSGHVGDIFSPVVQRRSSLPEPRHSPSSSMSDVSELPGNLTKHWESEKVEQKLVDLLDTKLESLMAGTVTTSIDVKLDELTSLIKAQLAGPRNLQDSLVDAKGEIDFEAIREAIEQGHVDARALIQEELTKVTQRVDQATLRHRHSSSELLPMIEQSNQMMVQAVAQTVARNDLSQQSHLSPEDREYLVRDLVNVLGPILTRLKPEIVDYENLTHLLSQAVKPHISQLIDLASDKRETASLIVECIRPLLPSPHAAPVLDTELVAEHLTAEIRRVMAPIDAHEIKEQVADLVVERLDSRLAVRDKAFNIDNVTMKVLEGLAGVFEPTHHTARNVDALIDQQKALNLQGDELASSHKDLTALLSNLPSNLVCINNAVDTAKAEILSKILPVDASSVNLMTRVESTLENLASDQQTIGTHTSQLVNLQQEVLSRLSDLPECLVAAAHVLQTAHSEFSSTRDESKQDADQIKHLKEQNAELQVQLAKARGAHGQVRVEKDSLVDKVRAAEIDRDRYRARVEEFQASADSKAAAKAAGEARTAELESALSQALERLKASDVAAQSNRERLEGLEKESRERNAEHQNIISKVAALQLQVTMMAKDKDAALATQKAIEAERDRLVSEQSHWDDLRRTTEQIEALTDLMSQADAAEVEELKRIRDQSHKLEGEHAALQKRTKDLENKATNSERTATAACQNLTQVQQRASEWEKRAKEYEGEAERMRTELEQAEQTHAQLDADYSSAKLQMEEKGAEDRLIQDRENNMRNQITSLENTVVRLEAYVAKVQAAATAPPKANPYQNGHNPSPPRPDSRASTAYGVSRSGTPVARVNGSSARSNTPPTSSVWDSMHAPRSAYAPVQSVHAPRSVKASRYPHLGPSAQRASYRAPSPTPSTVSATPTQGNDGWWS